VAMPIDGNEMTLSLSWSNVRELASKCGNREGDLEPTPTTYGTTCHGHGHGLLCSLCLLLHASASAFCSCVCVHHGIDGRPTDGRTQQRKWREK